MEGKDPFEGSEELTVANRVAEAVYLGLRTSSGLKLHPGEGPLVEPWAEQRWVTVDANDVLRCTPLGWLRLDALAAALTHHRSR
jgi:coproporphyrinogen III oxidase-like Fe-S oxidoreductase